MNVSPTVTWLLVVTWLALAAVNATAGGIIFIRRGQVPAWFYATSITLLAAAAAARLT